MTVRQLAKELSRIRGERRDKKVVFLTKPDGGFEPNLEYHDVVVVKEGDGCVSLLSHLPVEPSPECESPVSAA